MPRSGVPGNKGGGAKLRMPWTTAMLEHLERTGQSGWFTLDSVVKTGMEQVPNERALRQWRNVYARHPHNPQQWPQERRLEAGARSVARSALRDLEEQGVVVIDPPATGAGLQGRRAKRRVRLAPRSPVSRASPWVQVLYQEVSDGEWHDLQRVVRRMTQAVPPPTAMHNYRVNIASQQKGKVPAKVKATTTQQKIRDGAWDLCRRAVSSAKNRGRVEIEPDEWQSDIAGKRIRWIGYG